MKHMKELKKGLIAVCILALVQSIARFAIPVMISLSGGPAFDKPTSEEIADFVTYMFIIIGAVGLVTTYGLWNMKRWGYLGTILLSAATIAFDVWAVIEVQTSAAMGIVLPAVFIIYLLWIRKDFGLGDEKNASAVGIRH